MEQKDKDLLLQDLCSRLPYGVILNCCDSIGEKLTAISENGLINHDYDIDEVKPYLFPLSSMSVEHRCKVQNLLPDNCEISFKNQKITFYGECNNIQLEQLEKVFNFFNLFHFDYRGLIEKGLALDATGLNIY